MYKFSLLIQQHAIAAFSIEEDLEKTFNPEIMSVGEIAQVQLSDTKVRRCSFTIKDLKNQLMLKLKKGPLFAIQLGKTTDVNLQKVSLLHFVGC